MASQSSSRQTNRISRLFRGLSRPFALGLLAAASTSPATLYWLVETMTTFGGLPTALAVFAAFLLVAYLSLFPAVFALLVARATRSLGVRAILLAPAFWVATELGRQYVWDGFPWALLGYSQVTWLSIAQLASLVGCIRFVGAAGRWRRPLSPSRWLRGAPAGGCRLQRRDSWSRHCALGKRASPRGAI